MIVYHSGGCDKDWLTVLTYQRESSGMLIHYSGGTHEKARIPNLLRGTGIMLTFIDNLHRPEKVLRRIWQARRKRRK